jgi:ubiquinone/menaquinone biosynthesis C-methylase UbiE
MPEKDAFKFSGQGAINYDHYLGPLLFEPYAVELASRLNVDENITSILEIACGTGRVTRHLRRRFKPPVKLVASDLNPDMLQVAQTTLDDNSIEFRIEDAQNLSFPDNSFDVVVCQFGLMFLPDKQKGLREALRVLKPGGKFIFSTWDKTDNVPLLKLIFNDTVLPLFDSADAGRLTVPFSLHDPELLKEWMQAAGFKQVEANSLALTSGCQLPKDIVNGFMIKHSLGQETAARYPGEYDNICQKLELAVRDQFGTENLKFGLTAFFVSGEK